MGLVNMKFAELHDSLFLAGTNFPKKLNPALKQGLMLAWDKEERFLYVSYNGETTWVTETAVKNMTPGEPVRKVEAPPPVRPPVQAQASTPTAHVFEGKGGGKVRI